MNPWRATIWTANVLLAGAVAYAASITTSLVIERALTAAPSPAAVTRAEAPRARPSAETERGAAKDILDRNIFGARRVDRQVRAVPSSPVSEIFGVTLTGTFLAGDESFAMVIARGERQERIYRVGECLPQVGDEPSSRCESSQARLSRIELNRIVVVKSGKSIPIEIGKGPAQAQGERVSTRESSDRPRLSRERGRLRRTSKPEGNESGGEKGEESAAVSNAFPAEREGNTYKVTVPNADVEKAFENFSDVVSQAAAVPIIDNGEAQGFQLRKIRPGSIFDRLGLKNFDLIRGVNGKSLTTADEALRLFTVFRNERDIVLDVKRKDEELKFAYTVE